MIRDPLLRAWIWLTGLSVVSTAGAILVSTGALTGIGVTFAGAAILTLAWLKARVILSRYLGLASAPFWLRGFDLILGFYAVLLLVLYLVPGP